jgi:hypothetical protein
MSDRSAKPTVRKRPPSVFAKGDFLEGLSRGECPVCHATKKAARKYIHSFLYEGMMSPIARQEFLEGGGFCHEHFWQAKAIEEECWADGFGVAILCENLLESSLKDLGKLVQSRNGFKASLAKFRKAARERDTNLSSGDGCIACEASRSSEQHYIAALEEWLDDSDFNERFHQSTGLCLFHLRAARQRWTSETAFEAVSHVAKKWIGHLLRDLREFQRKHDYRFKHEGRGPEWTSPERSIAFLVGSNVDTNGIEDLPPVRRTRR